jgi:hypothetical protein
MYIYFQLDVNESRHKNVDDQYYSKLFETQYLSSVCTEYRSCKRRSQQLRDVGCVARILGLLLGILLQTSA